MPNAGIQGGARPVVDRLLSSVELWENLAGVRPFLALATLVCHSCGGWVKWIGDGWRCGVCSKVWKL